MLFFVISVAPCEKLIFYWFIKIDTFVKSPVRSNLYHLKYFLGDLGDLRG